MPRYALTIAYDGTDFAGWQKQHHPDHAAEPDAKGQRPRIVMRTVQEIVEQGVREVVREPVLLHGASRTDAGVHARAQCAAFTCSADASEGRGWPPERGVMPLVRAVNSRLPGDVLITGGRLVPDGFDPVRDCESKGYRYTFHVMPQTEHALNLRPLWDRRHVFFTYYPLDVERMRTAATHLVGEHDFAALAAINHGRTSTVRTILGCTVNAAPAPDDPIPTQAMRVWIDVWGTGFLYNMVRILAGTLMEVGRGRMEPGDMPALLASKDRHRAGPTLPPAGLRLEWIKYPPQAVATP